MEGLHEDSKKSVIKHGVGSKRIRPIELSDEEDEWDDDEEDAEEFLFHKPARAPPTSHPAAPLGFQTFWKTETEHHVTLIIMKATG